MLLKRGRRGVELTAAGESLLDHARLVIHNVEAMRGDLARFASGVRASVHLLANTSALRNICRRRSPRSCAKSRYQCRRRGRESIDMPRRLHPAPPIGFAAEHALPDNVERFVFGEDRLVLVTARRGPFATRRQIDFLEVAVMISLV